MKHGRIIVEGVTDCYFIHQLICKRFSSDFEAVYDNKTGDGFRYPVAKDDPDETFRFVLKSGTDITLEIRDNGGSSKEDVLRGLLRDESGETRDFFTSVIFDADYPARDGKDATGNGGFEAAKKAFSAIVPEEDLFLFPTNREDGALETLLHRIANARNAEFFTKCWPAFTSSLAAANPGPKRKLSAKTELADYVEAYGRKISDRKCYLQNMRNDDLWDYSSPELNDLVEFVKRFVAKF